MLIRKLILHNFRQYIGTQEIEFSTEREKNVTVLIGVNTSGKTTLIRAFEWILYNKNDFDDKNLLNKNVADSMQLGDTQSVWGGLLTKWSLLLPARRRVQLLLTQPQIYRV